MARNTVGRRRPARPALTIAALLLTLLLHGAGVPVHGAAGQAHVDVPLFDVDPMRGGNNYQEHAITLATVASLRHRWTVRLDGLVDSAPIELAGISAAGKRRDLFFLTSTTGTAMAVDAATGKRIWTFRPPAGEHLARYRITTAAPAADRSRLWIYSADPTGLIHKLAVATGRESVGWPVRVTLHPEDEKLSSALNVIGDTVLVTVSAYPGDIGHYTGHLVAIDTNTHRIRVFNALCSATTGLLAALPGTGGFCPLSGAGIWGRGGAVVDLAAGSPTAGQIFVATGNGVFDGHTAWGDSVLRLALGTSGFSVRDAFAPRNQQDLNDQDLDLGSTAPLLLPRQSGAYPWLLVQAGKDAQLRVLDRTRLHGDGPLGGLAAPIAALPLPGGGQVLTQPVAYRDRAGNTWIVIASANGLSGFRLTSGAAGIALRQAWVQPAPASSPLLAGGVLFAAGSHNVRAYDPVSGRLLWSSADRAVGVHIAGVHWQSPLVANGLLVLADESGALTCFGLPG
jgi:outer membrane protein assembly factor BamB